jgi:putative transposase
MNEALRRILLRLLYPIEVMLVCVRWYAAYPLSLRQIEQMMAERGVVVDHATIHRWSVKMLPILAAVFRRLKRPVSTSWWLDETYIKVSGEWKYLYRAVDRTGHTLDLLLRAHRDLAAARRFIERAIDLHGVPGKITLDKSGANTAEIVGMCADSGTHLEMREPKYLNNLIEQDHRAFKRAGPGNLNNPISVETAPAGEDLACEDWSKDEQKTPPHALSGIQSQSAYFGGA